MTIKKQSRKEYHKKYRRTKIGKIRAIYNNQIGSSKRRNLPKPTYSFEELKEWCLSKSLFHELYDYWKYKKYDVKFSPSCDRIDDYKPYTLDNLQLMNWKENNDKAHTDRVSGVNNKANKAVKQFTKSGNFITEFYSLAEAERKTKINRNGISMCVNNIRKSAGGFIWKFA